MEGLLMLGQMIVIVGSLGGLAIYLNKSTEKRLDDKIGGLAVNYNRLEQQLSVVNERLAGVDTRLSGLETKFSVMEERLSNLETKFSGLEERFSGLEEKFSGLERKFSNMEGKVDSLHFIIAPKLAIKEA